MGVENKSSYRSAQSTQKSLYEKERQGSIDLKLRELLRDYNRGQQSQNPKAAYFKWGEKRSRHDGRVIGLLGRRLPTNEPNSSRRTRIGGKSAVGSSPYGVLTKSLSQEPENEKKIRSPYSGKKEGPRTTAGMGNLTDGTAHQQYILPEGELKATSLGKRRKLGRELTCK